MRRAISMHAFYPEPLELYKWGGQSACMPSGEGNQHACKRTCVDAEQLEPPASATRDDIGFLRPEGGVPSPQLEVQWADLMRGAISDQVHSLRYNGRI
jgi:hypothetical protein